jgi:hypothetical protein
MVSGSARVTSESLLLRHDGSATPAAPASSGRRTAAKVGLEPRAAEAVDIARGAPARVLCRVIVDEARIVMST